jgi:peptide/nickel transport system substrate-binding protein
VPTYRGPLSKRRACLGTAAAALLSLFGCGGSRSAPHPDVELAVSSESTTLDPRFATRALDVRLSRLVHGSLVRLDPNTLEPEPYLAQSLTLGGERTILVTLRPTARFHSGAPLTSEDVCETLRALRDPALMSPHRQIVEAFATCRPTSPLSLTLELSAPRATWMTDLEVPILRADQAFVPREAAFDLDGLGPFRAEVKNTGLVRLLPANNGVLPEPKMAVSVRTIADETARTMSLLSGRTEILDTPGSLSLLESTLDHGPIVASARPGANVTYLLVHNERPEFTTPEVRRALSEAIDRRLITEHVYSNHAQPARFLLPPHHWAAPPSLPELAYEPERARAILSGRGPVTLLSSTDRSRVLVARSIAQMLEDAGLAVRATPLDLGLLLERLESGNYDLAILQIPELTEPNILGWFFHPRNVPEPLGRHPGGNRARYRSQEAGRLLDLASQQLDRASRKQTYADLATVMLADMPVIPLWHEDQIALVRGRGRGFRPSAESRWSSLAQLGEAP